MLLKISLILTILVGVATLIFTNPVKEKIDNLTTNLASAEAAKTDALAAQAKAQGEARTNKVNFEASQKELNFATNALAEVTTRLTEQQKRANKASADLVSVTEERNLAQTELNKWATIGMAPERIKDELAGKKRLEGEIEAVKTESKTLSRSNIDLRARLRKYEGDEQEVELPAGTKGRVVAVDPKFSFVVLDIGRNQNVLEGAKMMVSREGKLVAKVRITQVQPNSAIANVMPEWLRAGDEVQEGDQVVY